MSTNSIGIRQSNVFLPYQSSTKRTKQIFVTNPAHIVLTGTGITTSAIDRAVIMAYADSNGVWRLRFNINISRASGTGARTSAIISFASTYVVTFTSASQSVSVICGTNPIACVSQAVLSASYLEVYHASSDEASYKLSGDVELASEPTWAAANMEGVVAADVYIPSAAAGIAGLVNNTAGNTVGTPIKGRTDGQAVAAGYVGETVIVNGTSTASVSHGTVYADFSTNFVSPTFSKGTYLVMACGATTVGMIGGSGLQEVSYSSRIIASSAGTVVAINEPMLSLYRTTYDAGNNIYTNLGLMGVITLTSPDTFKVQGKILKNAGITSANMNLGASSTQLVIVRIA